MVRRGEVWLVALNPTVGSEIRKTRPCLIVSPDVMNEGLRTSLVAPLTSKGRAAPFRVTSTFGDTSGLILLDQLRTTDRKRLLKRLGTIDDRALEVTLRLLREMFSA